MTGRRVALGGAAAVLALAASPVVLPNLASAAPGVRPAAALLAAPGATSVSGGASFARSGTGAPDLTFGRAGQGGISVPGLRFVTPRSVAAAPDGSILVSGDTYDGREASPVALARLRPDGSPDPAFGDGGSVVLDRVPGAGRGGGELFGSGAMAMSSGGRILVVGAVDAPRRGGRSATAIAVARLLPDGRLDPSFGRDGVVTTSAGPGRGRFAQARDVLVTRGGRILVAAQYQREEASFAARRVVLALRPDGRLDAAYGARGRSYAGSGVVAAMALDRRGRVLLTGSEFGAPTARLRADGAGLDRSFGRSGQVNEGGNAILVRPDGAVVLAGIDGLLRLRADGRPDPSFARGGRAPLIEENVEFLSLLPYAGGVLVGAESFGADVGLLALFGDDGTLDPRFGGDGLAGVSVAPYALAADRRGSVLAADGISGDGGPGRFVVARHLGAADAADAADAATPARGAGMACDRAGDEVVCELRGPGRALWRAPAGVESVRVEVDGATGGPAPDGLTPGGAGGRSTGVIGVRPGDVLTVQAGGAGDRGVPDARAPGGFGGGGRGSTGIFAGGAGGGASFVGTGPDVADALVVAGGGGGASAAGPGGVGGGSIGGPGSGGAAGGTQSAGGANAPAALAVASVFPDPLIPLGASLEPAVAGRGNDGGEYFSDHGFENPAATRSGGGGGGGGWYGGGAGLGVGVLSENREQGVFGPGGSGAGGSGFAAASVRDALLLAGVHAGDGVVRIRYTLPAGRAR